jgi:hypothetical protein
MVPPQVAVAMCRIGEQQGDVVVAGAPSFAEQRDRAVVKPNATGRRWRRCMLWWRAVWLGGLACGLWMCAGRSPAPMLCWPILLWWLPRSGWGAGR